jgi:O-antigen ligase
MSDVALGGSRLRPRRRTDGRDVARDTARTHPLWWLAVGIILGGAMIFHSGLDPADRFALKQSGISYGVSWWNRQLAGPFTPSDLAVFAFAYLAGTVRFSSAPIRFSRVGGAYAAVIATAVAMGAAVGVYHGTESPIGDWRNLAVGSLFAFGLWSTVLSTSANVLRFAQLLAGLVSLYGLWLLLQYATGGGDIAFYGRTPVGDHSSIEYFVAVVAVSLAMLRSGRISWLWWLAIAIGTAVVLLSFRRYAWLEIGTVAAVFVLFAHRGRMRYIIGLAGVAAIAAAAIALTWNSLQWSERFASLDPSATSSQNELAATNENHLDDIRDGLDQIRAHPIFGLGVGVTYVGTRTLVWKGVAGMVHNGPVSVWIKFGAFGLIVYVVSYLALLRRLLARRRGRRPENLFALGALAFFIGSLASTATVYPWIFEQPGSALLAFAVMAAAFPRHSGARTPLRFAPSPAEAA